MSWCNLLCVWKLLCVTHLREKASVFKGFCLPLLPPPSFFGESSVSYISSRCVRDCYCQRFVSHRKPTQQMHLMVPTYDLACKSCHRSRTMTSVTVIHSSARIVIHQHQPWHPSPSFIRHHSSSCHLLLPNSFPLLPPAFLSGHTVV